MTTAARTVILWVAQGFGSGRCPIGPGTAGSFVGVGWLLILLWTGSFWLFAVGSAAAVFVSVWVCGEAEELIGRTDPPSVVLDEIIAVPLCYAGWVGWMWSKEHALPRPLSLFDSSTWLLTVALLILFRIFDIWKPWPVFQSLSLPGGWGITVDDVLAAIYVNLCWLVLHGANQLLHWW